MSHVTDKTLEVALLLLPVFCLIRFCFDYAQGLLGEEITFKALIRSLYFGVGLLLLLLSYTQFAEKLEWLMDKLARRRKQMMVLGHWCASRLTFRSFDR